jgi:hypothetical protein
MNQAITYYRHINGLHQTTHRRRSGQICGLPQDLDKIIEADRLSGSTRANLAAGLLVISGGRRRR